MLLPFPDTAVRLTPAQFRTSSTEAAATTNTHNNAKQDQHRHHQHHQPNQHQPTLANINNPTQRQKKPQTRTDANHSTPAPHRSDGQHPTQHKQAPLNTHKHQHHRHQHNQQPTHTTNTETNTPTTSTKTDTNQHRHHTAPGPAFFTGGHLL